MKYNSKNDINYAKFIEFTEAIEGQETNEPFISEQLERIFNTKDAEGFLKALESKKAPKINFKIDLDFKKAFKFIDADTFLNDNEALEFLKIVVKPRYFWQRINVYDLSYAQAEYVINLFFSARMKYQKDIRSFLTHLQASEIVPTQSVV